MLLPHVFQLTSTSGKAVSKASSEVEMISMYITARIIAVSLFA